jgi:hypothetical protein
VKILLIPIDRPRQLVDEVLGVGVVRPGPHLPHHRHQDRDQHADDRHHHHQLRERKSVSCDQTATATTNLLRHRDFLTHVQEALTSSAS